MSELVVGPLTADEPESDIEVRKIDHESSTSLVERYALMAHSFEPLRVDTVSRVLDVVLAVTALVCLAPVIFVVAVLLRLSGGPSFYRGQRVGRAGVIFQMYKFRTLRADAELRLGPYLGQELTRLTRLETTLLGRVLRATKFDEVPQLWNVIRGEMSIVGPRPIRPTFFEELCVTLPQYWQRLVVRPGITGFAQLRLTREMTWGEKLAHDFEYIADRSLHLYIHIIWQTFIQVIIRTFGSKWSSAEEDV